MTDLSKAQMEVLKLIECHVAEFGRPPTTMELAKIRGVNYSAIYGTLYALERKGAIKRTPGIARSIQLVNRTQ